MKLPPRTPQENERLLRAIHAVIGGEKFTPETVINRCAGMRARECPELVAALGRANNRLRLGHWLKTLHGARIDGVTLEPDYSTRLSHWEYRFVRPLPTAAAPPPTVGPWGVELQQVARETGKEMTVLPEDVDRLVMSKEPAGSNRYQRDLERAQRRKERADWEAQRKRDREAIEKDPEKTAVFNSWRCGRDGKPEPVEELPPPKAAPVVEQPEPSKPGSDGRPIWMREGRTATRQEWADWQRRRGATHQQHEGAARSEYGIDWFVAACEARNRRGFTS